MLPVGEGLLRMTDCCLCLVPKQQLQGNLAEHQVPVEKLQKAARSLLEVQGEPAPDHGHIRETTGTTTTGSSHWRGTDGWGQTGKQ